MKVVWVDGYKYIDNGVFLDGRSKTLEAHQCGLNGGRTINRTGEVVEEKITRSTKKPTKNTKGEKLKEVAAGTNFFDKYMKK